LVNARYDQQVDQQKDTLMKQFIRYFWGTIAHPRTTFDALATERTVRPEAAIQVIVMLMVTLSLMVACNTPQYSPTATPSPTPWGHASKSLIDATN